MGEGPHDIDCLANWWADAGCVLDAPSSPLQNTVNVEWWNERSVNEVKDDMALYTEYARESSEYDVKCRGTGS